MSNTEVLSGRLPPNHGDDETSEDERDQVQPQARSSFGVDTEQFQPGDLRRNGSSYTWIILCIAAICSCPLLGALGLYFNYLSKKQYNQGQYEKASKSSLKEMAFFTAAIVVGTIVVSLLTIPLNIFIGGLH